LRSEAAGGPESGGTTCDFRAHRRLSLLTSAFVLAIVVLMVTKPF
jgi:uncharacterized membrane protein